MIPRRPLCRGPRATNRAQERGAVPRQGRHLHADEPRGLLGAVREDARARRRRRRAAAAATAAARRLDPRKGLSKEELAVRDKRNDEELNSLKGMMAAYDPDVARDNARKPSRK